MQVKAAIMQADTPAATVTPHRVSLPLLVTCFLRALFVGGLPVDFVCKPDSESTTWVGCKPEDATETEKDLNLGDEASAVELDSEQVGSF